VNVAKQVAILMNELRSMIDQREKELLEAIEKQRKEQEKNLSAKREALDFLLESMNHCFEYTNHLLDLGNPVEIASTSQAVLSRLSTLLSCPVASQTTSKKPVLQLIETMEKEKKQEIQTVLSSLGHVIVFGPLSPQEESEEQKLNSLSSSFSLETPSSPILVRDYSAMGGVVRKIGRSGNGDLQFDLPAGMAIDQMGRIFVADVDNNRIQCLNPEGNFFFKFGSKGVGKGEFDWPNDIAFDPKNQRIYVADTLNHRIQAFDLEGTFIFAFGCVGKGKGQFNLPSGITTDKAGNIYVADRNNHRVQVFNDRGSFVRQIGAEGKRPGELKNPWGIGILSNGDVAVAEALSEGNQRLSIFTPKGRFQRFLGDEKLKDPLWLCIDPQDNILVVENGNRSLVVLSKEGRKLKQIGQGTFERAWGVVINQKGEIFVSGKGMDHQHHIFVF